MGRVITQRNGADGNANTANGQIELTPSEAVTAGDLLASNYYTGDIYAVGTQFGGCSLSAAPAVNYVTSEQASSTAALSLSFPLSDGKICNVVSSRTSDNQYMMFAYIQTAAGQIINRIVLEPTTNALGGIIGAELSNGNIAISYAVNTNSGRWQLLAPMLTVIASSAITAGWVPYFIQPTSNGGYIILGVNGIYAYDSVGQETTAMTITTASYPLRNPAVCGYGNHQTYNNGEINYQIFSIANGGYGILYTNNTSVNYVQLNADGSQRGTTVVLTTYASTTASAFCAEMAGNNICWVLQRSGAAGYTGYRGVVAQDGTIVRASTSLSDMTSGGGGYWSVAPLSNGGFAIVGSCGSAPNTNLLLTDSTGTALSGYPVTVTPLYLHQMELAPVSTGVAVVYWDPTGFGMLSRFYKNDGTAGAGQVLFVFSNGSSVMAWTARVYNDMVYVLSSSGSRGVADYALSTIDNTGVVKTSASYTGVAHLPPKSPWLGFHPGRPYLYCRTNNDTQSAFTCHRLSNLAQLYTYVISDKTTDMRAYFHNNEIICYSGSTETLISATPAKAIAIVKPDPGVILGVAAESGVAESPVNVNTAGTYRCNCAGYGSFDHTTSVPAGNKGTLTTGYITLKGLQ